jgi:hypothetical protein
MSGFAMSHSEEYRCPNCNSTDLVGIHTAAIDADLLECRSCMRLYKVDNGRDGSLELVAV